MRPLSDLEVIQAVVLTHLTLGVGDVVRAPLKGVAADLEERVRRNLARIGKNAKEKADGKPLEASHRVLFKALLEGGYAEDEVVVDYLGGVLAASTPDDAAAPIIAQIGRLSALQLRLHFVVYREIRRLCVSRQVNFYAHNRVETVIHAGELLEAVGGGWNALRSAMAVLDREGLLDSFELVSGSNALPARGVFTPSGLGADLFLWGNGMSPNDGANLLDPAFVVRYESDVPATPSARLVNPLQQ